MPASRASANWCCRNGTPATGRSGFGVCSVSGRSRVPCPPTRTIASDTCSPSWSVRNEQSPEPTLARVPATSPAQPTPNRRMAEALARDGARPLVTFYDDATGERTELSAVTFENWVAKTANLVVDGIGLAPGARVALLLPVHWQTAVWLAACWRTGTTAVLGG